MQGLLNRVAIIVCLSVICIESLAQSKDFARDIAILDSLLKVKPPDPFKRPYIYGKESSALKKYNPVSLVFGGSLYFYQNFISRHISSHCYFSPSCSEFSKEAIREYGFLKGLLLSVDRVNRCNRLSVHDLRFLDMDDTDHYLDPVSNYERAATGDDN